MSLITISGPRIYTETDVLSQGQISIKDGIITEINNRTTKETTFHFPAHYHLIPGFIDLHVHGAMNHDVMDATPNALEGLSYALATEGTTAYLATTMTASISAIEKTLNTLHVYQQNDYQPKGAAILGVHLEGPFLSPQKVGAQSAENLLDPDSDYIAHWQNQFANIIKLVTFAPEQPGGLALAKYLNQHNIVAAMGHTDATFEEAKAAIEAGCRYVTHCFNAMRPIHQREPGLITAALLSPDVKTEFIADGVHLHPAVVELAYRLKTVDQVILVTDSMRAKGLNDGEYDLGGQIVEVKNQVAKLKNGTLAGSTLRMPEAIKNMMQFTGCSLAEAVKMTAENPAKVLGLFHTKGSIALGKDADLVVLDEEYRVVMTMVNGCVVFKTAAINIK